MLTYYFCRELYHLLNKKSYYSLEINYATSILSREFSDVNLHTFRPNSIDSIEFNRITQDTINIFIYNGITYIGLESRRIDYERDAALGINWVEDAICNGEYG